MIAFGISEPVVLHTDDLASWTVEALDPDLFPYGSAPTDAVWFDGRLVVVGISRGGPTVWTHDR